MGAGTSAEVVSDGCSSTKTAERVGASVGRVRVRVRARVIDGYPPPEQGYGRG